MRKFLKAGKKVVKTFAKDYFIIAGVVTTGFIAALALESVYEDTKKKVKDWWNGEFSSDHHDEDRNGDDGDDWDQAEDDEFAEEDLEEPGTKEAGQVGGFDQPIEATSDEEADKVAKDGEGEEAADEETADES